MFDRLQNYKYVCEMSCLDSAAPNKNVVHVNGSFPEMYYACFCHFPQPQKFHKCKLRQNCWHIFTLWRK